MKHETRETAPSRRESDAVVNARQRVAGLAGTTGAQSPEYATALNQLALLLIMQGEPDAAEPLLKQALEIRRSALGELHPDFATNLSSLGGLLWARGDLGQAEPLLRQALEIRFETLGPSHPKSVVSARSLEQLLQAKADWDWVASPGPAAVVTQPAATPPPETHRDAAVGSVADQIADSLQTSPEAGAGSVSYQEISAARERTAYEFAGLGERLARLGERFSAGVLPPDDDLRDAWSHARDGFERLRRDVLTTAQAYAVSTPPGGLASLDDATAVLPALRAEEDARVAAQSGRRDALLILDRIDRLHCPTDPVFEPLSACHALAGALRQIIESCRPGELPDQARELNEGRHPLAVLLALLTADDETGDAQWADWYDDVADSFGNAMAVACARSRITSLVP